LATDAALATDMAQAWADEKGDLLHNMLYLRFVQPRSLWCLSPGYVPRRLEKEKRDHHSTLEDIREWAVTLDDIARIRGGKRDIEQAHALHLEMLNVYEALGDQDGIANALWAVAQIELQQQHYQEAFEHLAKSYGILQQIGRLDGIWGKLALAEHVQGL
jgi:tetratricopeptide (TPR) repeat protein